MNVFQRYVAYLKDNPEHYWFRNKVWGWGWVPATWEGWATLAVFIAGLGVLIVSFANILQPTDTDTHWFIGKVFALVIALLIVTYWTGEPPSWQWGFPEEKNK